MTESKHKKFIYIDGKKTKYIVTDRGTVYSTDYMHTGKSKPLKTRLDKDGYVIVTIYLDGKRYDKKMHRLVAEAFIPNPKNKPEVNHKNGIKTKNSKRNLEWVTTFENLYHAWDTGLSSFDNREGENNAYSKHTNQTIRKVCKALESNKLTIKEISEKYGVSRATIEQILLGNQWTFISKDYNINAFTNKRKLIDDKVVIKICKLLEKGKLNMCEIAKKVGVSYGYVYKVYNGETKKSISKKYDFSNVKIKKK